jgi:hypothetical protein
LARGDPDGKEISQYTNFDTCIDAYALSLKMVGKLVYTRPTVGKVLVEKTDLTDRL